MQTFVKSNPQPGPPSVIHQTYEPDIDTLDHVSFDVKMAGVTGHMSSKIILEREFDVQVQLPNKLEEEFALNTPGRVYRPYIDQDSKFAVMPGFVLQDNAENVFLNFNGGSLVLDTKWLSNYARLYRKSLKPAIRGAGRSFSNHNDSISRNHFLNGTAETRYCNPERNDRRIDVEDDTDAYVYWDGVGIGQLGLTLANNFQTLFNWPANLVEPQYTIPRTDGPMSPSFINAYQTYHAQHDDTAFNTLRQYILDVFDTDDREFDLHHASNLAVQQLTQNYLVHHPNNNPDIHGFLHNNHYGLDYDLNRPFNLHQGMLLHVRTLALAYKFYTKLVQYGKELFAGPNGDDLRNARAEAQRVRDGLAIAQQYDALINTIVGQGGAAQPHQVAQATSLQNQLIAMGLPHQTVNNQTASQQIQVILTAATNVEYQENQALWGMYQNLDDPAVDFSDQCQIFARWANYISEDHTKDPFSINTGFRHGKIKIYEPLMVGTAHADFGCWNMNSPILPYIERFRLGMRFKQDAKYFELDQCHNDDFVFDFWTGERFFPRLVPTGVKSKLHVKFIEGALKIPSAIGYLDTVTEKIGGETMTKGDSYTFEFSDISLRRTPTVILFYTRARHLYDDALQTDKAASIKAVTLRTDLSPQVLKIDDRHTIDIVTADSFDEYIPPIRLTGNCLALPFSKIPRRKTATADYDNLHGQITVGYDWGEIYNTLSVEVFVTLFYQDSFLDVMRNYQTGKILLDEI